MGKTVKFDKSAYKELKSFPRPVFLKFQTLFEILEENGRLELPFGKKLVGNKIPLFEIRVKHQGQWRALYAYLLDHIIIILTVFAKKTQKTPQTEITTAIKRYYQYQRTKL